MLDASNKAVISKGNDELIPREEGKVYGEVMHVTSKTKGVNFDDILVKLMQYANMADALAHVEKTVEYVVQIPIKHRKAYQAGEVFINQNSKTGVMWPTLYRKLENGKRQFVDNLPIRQEQIIHGNPFESIAISYHNVYIQRQIHELVEIMDQTYKAVERIEQGQMDDRIGLLLAGKDQIRLSIHSTPLDGTAIRLGQSKILTAQKQLLQTFKRRVGNFEAIPNSAWSQIWIEIKHSGTFRQKDREFSEIQEYYKLYLQATHMLAASYVICGQPEAAEQVFEIAEHDMKEIDFSALKTLRYIHKKNLEMLYDHAAEYVAKEREICMEGSHEYDTMSIEVSGAKLLEAFENERTKEVPESRTGQ